MSASTISTLVSDLIPGGIPKPIKRRSTTALFGVLREPVRQSILRGLDDGSQEVHEICDLVNRRQQAVSHHLTIMKLQGLVKFDRNGKSNLYRLTPYGRHALDVMRAAEWSEEAAAAL